MAWKNVHHNVSKLRCLSMDDLFEGTSEYDWITSQGCFTVNEGVIGECFSLACFKHPCGHTGRFATLTNLLWQIALGIIYTIPVKAPGWIRCCTKGLAITNIILPYNWVGHVTCIGYLSMKSLHIHFAELTMAICPAQSCQHQYWYWKQHLKSSVALQTKKWTGLVFAHNVCSEPSCFQNPFVKSLHEIVENEKVQ